MELFLGYYGSLYTNSVGAKYAHEGLDISRVTGTPIYAPYTWPQSWPAYSTPPIDSFPMAGTKGDAVAKFRKRPVVIEAMQFTEASKDQVLNFVTCTRYPGWNENGDPTLTIGTLEGDMTAVLGDWIIKGVQGEFYPCRADIFRATYELVE